MIPPNEHQATEREKPKVFWPVLILLGLLLGTTLALWTYESNRVRDAGHARFEREALDFQNDILATMETYAQVLRGGAGLFHSSSFVSRKEWAQYVSDLKLEEYFPGIQGVSYNRILRGPSELAAFENEIRKTDHSDFSVRPEGDRALYSPVLYIEPMDWRNERAVGFDIYSESIRRQATDRAIATGKPQLTAKITLVQEDPGNGSKDVQSGVLLLIPVFDTNDMSKITSATERRAHTTGMIAGVFRMGDLTSAVLKSKGSSAARIDLALYDSKQSASETLLFERHENQTGDKPNRLFETQTSFPIFGRNWTLVANSTAFFEAEVASNSPAVILIMGLLLTALVTALAWGQSVRVYESEHAANVLARSQDRVQFLMGEVNHRSKNLLALVEAIARQSSGTSAAKSDPKEFMAQFSSRVRALAANQDLLVRNEWKGINLNELIRSQLAHFEGHIDERILLDGPAFQLNPSAAQTVGMAIHELATNAGKYGALSNGAGTVDINWSIKTSEKGQSRLILSWIETGGPPVQAPSEGGFGSQVLGVMAQQSLGATIETKFENSGFAWHLDCPTRAAAELGEHLK